MTCPDWTALTAHRRVRDGVEPVEWAAARAHASACPACRHAAVAADPTLVFQRLGEPEPVLLSTAERAAGLAGSAGSGSSADIAAMQQAVATLRRARATTAPGRRRSQRQGWRVAAAVALPLCALMLHGVPRRPERDRQLAGSTWQAERQPPVAAAITVPSAELVALPLVGDLDNPAARVYELGGTDLAVVMIVDETLDV